jgi:2-polyprenyl-3-methyl-5-hydroxy-6-metoxy-1,4-benzoquinol methylase
MVQGKYKINIYNKYCYEYLIQRLTRYNKLLDIGCGTGDFALAIASQGLKTVIGVDSSEKAIQKANAKLIKTNLNCKFVCADASSLNTETLFDYVVLNDLLEHLSDEELKNMFKKINHILEKDGEVVIHTPNGLSLCNDTDSNLLQKIYKIYLLIFKKFRGFERTVEQIYYDQVHINIKSYRQLRRFLMDFGYKTEVIYDEKGKLPFLNQFSSNMLVIARKY